MDTELREDVLDMMPDGVRAHVELFSDLPIRSAPRQQARDLRFTPGEPEAPERQILFDRALVRQAHGHSYLECREQELEHSAGRGSRARASRAHRRFCIAIR